MTAEKRRRLRRMKLRCIRIGLGIRRRRGKNRSPPKWSQEIHDVLHSKGYQDFLREEAELNRKQRKHEIKMNAKKRKERRRAARDQDIARKQAERAKAYSQGRLTETGYET